MADIIDLGPVPGQKPQAISEDLVARQFSNRHRNEFRYCHDHGAWFRFDGSIWRRERVPSAFHEMRLLSVEMSASASNRTSMQKASYVSAAEKFARADPFLSVTAADWDADIFLLGTPSGTVDLRTGLLRESVIGDRITKSTAVAPAQRDICPVWMKFLREATGNDRGLIRFLQQICGYALSGDITEQMLFFIFGGGGNGKGTFLNALQGIMADYSVVAPMEALENQRFAQHTTDLAMMRGARLVSASETREDGAWNENRIKALTGGDRITARFMHRDNITFTPQLTLLVIGNHQPTLKTVDKAIQRRFNMIPFTIEPTEVDKHLDQKLKTEWPAILRWMIDGCLDWQKNGFQRPARVITETLRYFEEQDVIGEWLRECCDADPENEYLCEKSSVLFASWSKFAVANGIEPGNTKTFKPTMARLGFNAKRSKDGVWLHHIQMRDANFKPTNSGLV